MIDKKDKTQLLIRAFLSVNEVSPIRISLRHFNTQSPVGSLGSASSPFLSQAVSLSYFSIPWDETP